MKTHRALAAPVARYDAAPLALAAGELRWLLGCICQAHRTAFDPDLAERQFPPPHTALSVRTAAEALGFELRSHGTGHRIDRMVMPVVAFAEGPTGATSGTSDASACGPTAYISTSITASKRT